MSIARIGAGVLTAAAQLAALAAIAFAISLAQMGPMPSMSIWRDIHACLFAGLLLAGALAALASGLAAARGRWRRVAFWAAAPYAAALLSAPLQYALRDLHLRAVAARVAADEIASAPAAQPDAAPYADDLREPGAAPAVAAPDFFSCARRAAAMAARGTRPASRARGGARACRGVTPARAALRRRSGVHDDAVLHRARLAARSRRGGAALSSC